MKKSTLIQLFALVVGILSLCSCELIQGKKKMVLSADELTYSIYESNGYSYDAYMTNNSFLLLKYNDETVNAITKNISYTYQESSTDSNSFTFDKNVDEVNYSYNYNSTSIFIDNSENTIAPISSISSFVSAIGELEDKNYTNVGDSLIKAIAWGSSKGYYLINDDVIYTQYEISSEDFNSKDNPYFTLFPCYDNSINIVQPKDLVGNPREFVFSFLLSKNHKTVYPYFNINCYFENQKYMYLSPYDSIDNPYAMK